MNKNLTKYLLMNMLDEIAFLPFPPSMVIRQVLFLPLRQGYGHYTVSFA